MNIIRKWSSTCHGLLLIKLAVVLLAIPIVTRSAVGQGNGSAEQPTYPLPKEEQETAAPQQPARSTRQPRRTVRLSVRASITCQSSRGRGGNWFWRQIEGRRCWYRGDRRVSRNALRWPARNRSPRVSSQKEPPPRLASIQHGRSLGAGLDAGLPRADVNTDPLSWQRAPTRLLPPPAALNRDLAFAPHDPIPKPAIPDPGRSRKPPSLERPKAVHTIAAKQSAAAAHMPSSERPRASEKQPAATVYEPRLSDGGRMTVIAIASAIALALAALAYTIFSSGQWKTRSGGHRPVGAKRTLAWLGRAFQKRTNEYTQTAVR
jgi:hypothetical protein